MRQIPQTLDFTERNALGPRLNLLLDLLDREYAAAFLLRGSKDSAETSVSDGSCDFVAVHVDSMQRSDWFALGMSRKDIDSLR